MNDREIELLQKQLEALKELTGAIGLQAEVWPRAGLPALQDFAVALSLEDVRKWSLAEKQALVKVIRAKSGLDESNYLKLMQKHHRLRKEVIRLGS